MSIIDSFSLEYRFSKRKKKSSSVLSQKYKNRVFDHQFSNNNTLNNNINNNIIRNKTTISNKIISVQLLDKLTSLGYNIDSIMALAKQRRFSTVEEALDLLEKDSETHLYNHYFCPINFPLNNNKCRICGNSISEHINDEDSGNNSSGNKLLNQPNEQYFSIKENNNGEDEKNNNNKFDIKNNNNNNNSSINNQSSILNGGFQIFNDSSPARNKSSFSPEHKSRRIKMKANNQNNTLSNNNSSSLLLLKNLNDCNEKKPIIENLNNKNINIKNNINNNLNNINNNINNNNIIDINNDNTNKKANETNENRTINNISIDIKEHFSNFNKGENTVNFNRPIFIRINTINSGRKSKQLKDLEYLKKDNQSHTFTVPIKRKDNTKNEINTIININDYVINGNENINNTMESHNSKAQLNNNIKLPNYCKVNIPKETLQLFNNPDICPICYNNEVNKNNIAQEHCQHKFCDNCINSYLTNKIINGEVLDIKCMMAGCSHIYSQEEIKLNIERDIFNKYKKFYRIQKKLKNPDKKYINCPFVDCEELVDCTNISEGIINCDKGHAFCRKCYKIGGHANNCTKEDINMSFFKELKKNNSRGVSIRYKQCPECEILIEKIDGCNQMKCSNCGYVFCWLCLKEYTPNHFSIYNVNGCPGMRFENDRTYKIRSNPCLNCIWHLLSCLLGVGMFILIYLFYIVCGCCYEFVKCYKNRREQNDSESDFSINDISDERSVNIRDRNSCLSIDRSRIGNNLSNTNNIIRVNKMQLRKKKKDNKYIIALLICLGILCQPIYLTFYFLYALIECYKRLNCLFYFPD